MVLSANISTGSAAEWELCDFENAAMCDFINDPTATIDWKREEQLIGSKPYWHLIKLFFMHLISQGM